jgi:3D (Asp-Asp-Asp) domain-containing protein
MAVLRNLLVAAALSASALLPSVAHAEEEQWRENVRLTFYTNRGVMRWGEYTHLGAVACGSYFPAGTKLQFVDDDWVVICKDTGNLSKYQVDVWVPSYAWGIQNVEKFYGLYTWVKVLRWGWE